jgi:hypothetical protein
MATSMAPNGHPTIPNETSLDEVVAIVAIHHTQAQHANQNTPYIKTPIVVGNDRQATQQPIVGVNVFLRRINGQPCFAMGRATNREIGSAARREQQDVYLPGAIVALRQCTLLPDWERDCWRLQSSTETVADVNGAPIQNYTPRTKRLPNPLPKAIYLKQSDVNHITINGLQVDVWLMKSVREVYGPEEFTPAALEVHIQNVAHRPEQWARNRYDLTPEQVSTKTFRVLNRFTGEIETAKIFRTGEHQQQVRDQEFLMFNKQDVDASIVRYLQCTKINSIPSIITDTHEGFATYGALQDDIRKSHPGVRFAMASKLLRRLFSALAFMHFHSVIHGHVSNDSVLLRLVDQKVEHVLLVDYTNAYPFVPGAPVPMEDMIADGRSTMELVEDCCDIWAFRNGPTENARGEDMMQKRTMDTMRQYQKVQQTAADYFERQGNSRETMKGQKLNRLLNKLGNAWQSAKAHQAENLAARQVALLSKSKIDAKIQEWESAHPSQTSLYKQDMLLSLGHKYLDSLADQLYVKRWETTPQEVCTKVKELGGSLEEPWQTFEVRKTTLIRRKNAGYDEDSVLTWLASCYETQPEWRLVLETECQNHLQPDAGTISQANLGSLCNALQVHGQLSPPMMAMFKRFMDIDTIHPQVEETYQVWYHIPSRLFNLTQLQRLATPERLVATVTENEPRCDNFVEVRGDPKLQGCYASLTLLAAFADQLGLHLSQTPNLTTNMPTLDPSDFSQVPQGRIVLARPGLIGFGTMLRSGDQCNFLYSRTEPHFDTPSAFIPTHFGDMKVLPQLPPNVRSYDRPEHWSRFKTAEEFEESADLSKRQMLKAKKPKAVKAQYSGAALSTLSNIMEIDETALGQVLGERERVRSEARPLPKRATDAISSKPVVPSPKRSKTGAANLSPPKKDPSDISQSFVQRMEDRIIDQSRSAQPPVPHLSNTSFMNSSFMRRNSALLTSPPLDPTNSNQSFTVADETEGLEDDWAEVEAMLSRMPDDEDEELVAGITGFKYHGSMSDESDEETSKTPQFKGKGKGKATALLKSRSLPKSVTPSFTARQSGTPRGDFSPSQSSGKSPFGSPVKSFRRAHTRNKSELSNASAVSDDDIPPTEPSSPVQTASPAQSGPSPQITPGLSVLKFGSLGISGFPSFDPAIPTQPDRNPFSDPSNACGTGFQPTQPSQRSCRGSFGPDMPPTQGNSPVGNFTSNPLQSTTFPPSGGSSTQPNIPPQATFGGGSFGSDMPPTQANSPAGGSFDPNNPGIRNGVYSNPGSAIAGFFRENVTSGDDEDMPDTDGESEAGDENGGQ